MIFKANENNELTLFGKTIKEIQTGMDKIRNGQMMGQGNASTGLTAFVQSLKGVNDEIAQLKILTKDETASYFSKFIEASKSGKQVTADFLDDLETTDKTMAGYLRTVKDGEPVFQDYQKYCDNLVTSNKQVAASSKVAALGMKALSMAGNMLLIWGITKIIGEIAESIEEYTHRIDNAKESISNLSSEMKELKSTLDDTGKTVDDISQRFAELYQGIDSNTGKNRSLNTEEYEEFLKLNNQLAELFPSLSRTYNENGEAILQLSGDVDTIVGSLNALVEAQRELTNQEIADKLPELYENFQTVNNDKKSGYQKQLEDLDKQTERYKKYLNQLRELSSWDDLNSENGVSDEYTDLLTQMYIDTDDLGEHFSKKSIDSVIKYYESELKDLNAELVKVTNEQKSSWNTLLQSLFAEVGNDETYKLLSDQAQAGVQDIINALDFSELSKKYKTSDALVGFISDNIINPISSNQELKDAFAELYSLEPGDLDRVKIAKEIQSILDGMDLEVPIDIMPIVSEEQDAQNRLKNSFADVIGDSTTANYGDYKRMEAEYKLLEEYTKDFTQAEVEAWLESTDGAESATEAIRKYEEFTANAAKEMEKLFTEDQIKRLDEYQSKLSSLADSYSKLLSGNYSRSDILDIIKSLSEKGFDISHVDSINSLQGLIKYSTIATDDLDKLINELGIEPTSDLADFLRDMTYETLRVDSAFEGLSTRLNNLKGGYITLKDAIDEYNKSGKLTTETFDALMNMDYDNLFSVLSNGKIEIDKEGIRKELLDYIADVRNTLIEENNLYVDSYTNEVREDYQTKKKLLDEFEEYVKSSGFSLDDIFGAGETSSSTSSTFDWIEIKINNIKEAIEELREVADDPFASWANRGSALQRIIDKLESSRDDYDKAYKAYLSEAEKVGLGSTYKTLVKEGKFDIESFKDDPNYEKIQKYQELYEKAQEMAKLRDSVSNELNSGIQDSFDLIISEFDSKLSHYENTANLIESKLANAESKGYIATQQYYQTLRGIEEAKRVELKNQLDDLTQAFNESGLEPDTEGWSELVNKIEETELALQESTNAMQEFNNEIRQIDWDLFDFARDQESKFMNEADFMIDLLDSAKMFSEAGEITAEGMATMGLHAANYNAYLEQSISYAEELAKRQAEIETGSTDRAVIDRYNELLELQQESILSAESEKDAMIDLVSEGIELQKEAFQGLIDEYTEALDIQKDLYDYQKKNSEQTKKIANIQKQLAAYQGDQSEEARAKVQQLKVQLDEEQSNLESDQYDRYISDQKEILNTIYEDYETTLDIYLDNATRVISDSINMANKNATTIGKTLTKATNEVGYDVKNVWIDERGLLSVNFSGIKSNIQAGTNILHDIKESNDRLIAAQKSAISESLGDLSSTDGVLNQTLTSIRDIVSEINGKISGEGGGSSSSSGTEGGGGNTPSGNNEKVPNGNGGNFTAGATLKKVTGTWYAASDGTGNSGSVTTAGATSWKIDKINEGSKYPYHIIGYKNGKFAGSGWVKKSQISAYKTGARRIDEDQNAWTQENGTEYIIRPSDGAILTPLYKGDSVLNAEATKNLWNMANNPMQFIKDNMSTSIPNAPSNGNSNIENNIQMTITLPGVTNYQEFVSRLQSDKKFEKMIVDVTSSALTGSNSLSKYRHKF